MSKYDAIYTVMRKFGCCYTIFEVQKNDGQLLAVEMREVGQLMPKQNCMCYRKF